MTSMPGQTNLSSCRPLYSGIVPGERCFWSFTFGARLGLFPVPLLARWGPLTAISLSFSVRSVFSGGQSPSTPPPLPFFHLVVKVCHAVSCTFQVFFHFPCPPHPCFLTLPVPPLCGPVEVPNLQSVLLSLKRSPSNFGFG